MKQKDKDVLHASTSEELQKKLTELSKSLAHTIKERYTKQSKNTRSAKLLRQAIAQVQTVIREKELTV